MKKYKIIYENGKEGFIDVCKEDTMISVFEKLVKDKVKYIFVSGEKMKVKTNFKNKPIVLHSKIRDFYSSISEDTTLEELKERIKIIDESIGYITLGEELISISDLKQKDLKKYLKEKND